MCFYFRQSKKALAVANRFKAKFREDIPDSALGISSGQYLSLNNSNANSLFEAVNSQNTKTDSLFEKVESPNVSENSLFEFVNSSQVNANISSLNVNGSSTFEMVNGFSHPKCPVITDSEPRFIDSYTWGLIPSFAIDSDIQKFTLNARIETVDTKPSFRNSIGNRCHVIADGFYEWKEVSRNGKKFKQKYLIAMPDEQLFAFAGLYSFWNDRTSGIICKTFTILTTEANSAVAAIHSKNRMPVILKQNEESLWLEGAPHTLFANRTTLELVAY